MEGTSAKSEMPNHGWNRPSICALLLSPVTWGNKFSAQWFSGSTGNQQENMRASGLICCSKKLNRSIIHIITRPASFCAFSHLLLHCPKMYERWQHRCCQTWSFGLVQRCLKEEQGIEEQYLHQHRHVPKPHAQMAQGGFSVPEKTSNQRVYPHNGSVFH